MIRRLARSFGVDPWTVLTWEPDRIGFAITCERAHVAFSEHRASQAAKQPFGLFPVYVLGEV